MVIPGKTPLPPNKELPLRLKNVDLNAKDSLDENIWIRYKLTIIRKSVHNSKVIS